MHQNQVQTFILHNSDGTAEEKREHPQENVSHLYFIKVYSLINPNPKKTGVRVIRKTGTG